MESFISCLKLLQQQYENKENNDFCQKINEIFIQDQLVQSFRESRFVELSKSRNTDNNEYLKLLEEIINEPIIQSYPTIYLCMIALIRSIWIEEQDWSDRTIISYQLYLNTLDTFLDCFDQLASKFKVILDESSFNQKIYIKAILFDLFCLISGKLQTLEQTNYKKQIKIKNNLNEQLKKLQNQFLQKQEIFLELFTEICIDFQEYNECQFTFIIWLFERISQILFFQYWIGNDNQLIDTIEIQLVSVKICEVYYKFSINLFLLLEQSNQQINYLYQIINNAHLIAFGIKYKELILYKYFNKNGELVQMNDYNKMFNQERLQLTIQYNKYFGIGIALLFETFTKKINKQFYLKLLLYLLNSQMQMLLTFSEYLPKFVYYIRLERDEQIIQIIKEIIVTTLTLTQDTKIIKQLFETLSYHQSNILMHDLKGLNLDEAEIYELQQAYRIANLSQNRILLFNQKQQLISAVDDIKYYSKVVKVVLEIFLSTYQKWQELHKDLNNKKSLIHFQEGQSNMQIVLPETKQNQNDLIELNINLRLIKQNNNSKDTLIKEQKGFQFGSFLFSNQENFEKQILISLIYNIDTDITLMIQKNDLILLTRQGGSQQVHKTNVPTDVCNWINWFNLQFNIGKGINKVTIFINNQKIINTTLSIDQKLKKIIIGPNLEIDKHSYSNDQIDMLESSFNGQISQFEFNINFDDQKKNISFVQFNRKKEKEEILYFKQSNQQKMQLQFDDLFQTNYETYPTFHSNNIYVLNVTKGLNCIHNQGNYKLYFMILDVFYTIYECQEQQDSFEIILLILKLIEQDLIIDPNQQQFLCSEKVLEIFSDHIKQWIQLNKIVPQQLIDQLFSILNKITDELNSGLSYFLSLIQILDTQYLQDDIIQEKLQTEILKSALKKYIDKGIKSISNIQLINGGKCLFTEISYQIAINKIPNIQLDREFFYTSKYKRLQIQNDYVNRNTIVYFFSIIEAQEITNLFTINILQIIEILLQNHCCSVKKQEEEQIQIKWKNILISILDKLDKNATQSNFFLQQSYLQDKIYEIVFSIYFDIVKAHKQLKKNSQDNIELVEFINHIQQVSQLQLGECFISKLISIIDQSSKLEDQIILQQILKLINLLYQQCFIQENSKDQLSNYFLNIFKAYTKKEGKSPFFFYNLLTFQDFGQFLKNLIPFTLDQNKNNMNSELFQYIIIYLLEQYQKCTSELLYKIHIDSIFSKITFNSLLQGIYLVILQFSANLQCQKFDSKIYGNQLINIITALLHIEQCFSIIQDFDFINWNLYAQILKCAIDLFDRLQILFFDLNLPISTDKKINVEIIGVGNKLLKGRIIPNGGIQRLMMQLIAPYISIIQMKDIIKLYFKKLEKNLNEILNQKNKQKIKQPQQQNENEIEHNYEEIQEYIQQSFPNSLINSPKINQNGRLMLQKEDQKNDYLKSVKKKFSHLLIYYALNHDRNYDDQHIKTINDCLSIIDKEYEKLYEWKNVDENLLMTLSNQENCVKEIKQAFENILQFKNNHPTKKESMQHSFDLCQIEMIRADVSQAIQNSIFLDTQMYFQFIHIIWLKFPTIADPGDMNKSQSNLQQLTQSDLSSPQLRDSFKKTWQKEQLNLMSREGLFYFLDGYLQPLFEELNKFIESQEFRFELLENFQLKMQVSKIEDQTRKREQLIKVKLLNTFKPYIKISSIKKLDAIRDSQKQEDFTITLRKQENTDDSLSHSITKRAKRRFSIKSEQIIQPLLINEIQQSFRKGSGDTNINIQSKYNCEYITQEGSYRGGIKFNNKTNSFIFKSEKFETLELFTSPDLKIIEEQFEIEILLQNIKVIHQKRFLLREIAFEIFSNRTTYFFNMFKTEKLNDIFQEFSKRQIRIIKDKKEEFKKQNLEQNWAQGQNSNFFYLMSVNTYSGRTYNDLSQYFIFPWVIDTDKVQQQIVDTTWKRDSKIFRDLTLPIGAIGKGPSNVKKEYKEKDRSCLEENFMYGSHYSNAAVVFNYLIRLEPFNELHFALQKNKFDVADRLFSNIDILWENSKKQDYKELIPEFYYMPEFLQNINNFDFGTLQSTQKVTDVILPKWVKTQTPEEYIFRMRQALESETVSENLNYWIDLIFGINSVGQNAIDNYNVFHYLTYEQNLVKLLTENTSEKLLQSYISQIYYFGQTPQQLFFETHKTKRFQLQIFTNQTLFSKENNQNKSKLKKDEIWKKKQDSTTSILSFYIISLNLIFLLEKNQQNNIITLSELKISDNNNSSIKYTKNIPFIICEGCNYQNQFCFIYNYRLFDCYDSQYYSQLEEKTDNQHYFCFVSDKQIKFFNLMNKSIQEISIESNQRRQKQISCFRYHSFNQLLAIGTLDGTLLIYELKFNQQIKSNCLQSKPLKHSIISIDMSDSYILITDSKNMAQLMTLELELLHSIQIDTHDIISQCILQAQFMIFKTFNSQLSVYTINANPYISSFQLPFNNSQNIVFTAPFSSKFAIFTQNSSIIHFYDIFDIYFSIQQMTSLNPEDYEIKKKGGIYCLHIQFGQSQIQQKKDKKQDEEDLQSHFYYFGTDNELISFYYQEKLKTSRLLKNFSVIGMF